MIWLRLLLAAFWTLLWPPAVYFAVGFSMLGDCAADVPGRLSCFDAQRIMGWTVLAVGIAIFAGGYWLLFRPRSS